MIQLVKGDVTQPIGDGTKLIVHCCNDIGVMGAGVAKAIADKWPTVKNHYKSFWYNKIVYRDTPFVLGQIQIVQVEKGIYVCNLIGQRDIRGEQIGDIFLAPIRYEALEEGFIRIKDKIKNSKHDNISLHMPMIGAGLARGNWNRIYYLIDDILGELPVTIYCFTEKDLLEAKKTVAKIERLKYGVYV